MSTSDSIRLADPSDLTIEVIEYDHKIEYGHVQVTLQRKPFLVDRNTLRRNSMHLNAMLDPHGRFKEATMDHVVFEDDCVEAMEIWFRIMHNRPVDNSNVGIAVVRQLIGAADKYSLNLTHIYDWFGVWYEQWDPPCDHPNDEALLVGQLLYPTWRLNHADGFAFVSEYLAYNSMGHTMEVQPYDNLHLHLPSRVIQQLNAARGRLRTILDQRLFEVTATLFQADCRCKEKTLFGYEKALYDVHAWPLSSEVLRNTIRIVLDRLKQFRYRTAPGACQSCNRNYERIVRQARENTETYFDGLCLDCLDRSKPKTENEDTDYWRHHTLQPGQWDAGCRVSHGQPSWYFSFMGRKEDRDAFLSSMRQGRRG
ncbi:MAG: hypothetical protein Q9170_006612 [Blastenia crenularia]